MEPNELLQLVKQMRNAQIAFFHKRTGDNLIRAKDLEKRVDIELKTYFNNQTE